MMQKLLSIIIPTYNMEALLDQCLTSLILETKEQREKQDVIVVIDGATDRSSEIAHGYAEKYPEMFSVIDKGNGNYGSCINAALPHVKGKYVRILDADDSYRTENLLAYLNVLETQDVDLILSDYDTVDDKGNVTSQMRLSFVKDRFFLFSDIPVDTFIAMHVVAYRSSIFKVIDYHQTEGISYTDMEWVFHPMSKVEKVYFFNKPIYKYLIGREGQTVDADIKLKKVGDTVLGLINQVKLFKNIPTNVMAYPYLENLLFVRAKFIYLAHITQKVSFDLMHVDRLLKDNCRSVYNRLNTVKVHVNRLKMDLPVIRMWRNPLIRIFLK